jgi:hypothetical protein
MVSSSYGIHRIIRYWNSGMLECWNIAKTLSHTPCPGLITGLPSVDRTHNVDRTQIQQITTAIDRPPRLSPQGTAEKSDRSSRTAWGHRSSEQPSLLHRPLIPKPVIAAHGRLLRRLLEPYQKSWEAFKTLDFLVVIAQLGDMDGIGSHLVDDSVLVIDPARPVS